ncbi:transposase [bacterium]|nr:transposase [bacterium]
MVKKHKFRRKFDKAFKLQAVKMVLDEGIPVIEVAKKLEVNQVIIHRWKQEYEEMGEKESFPGKGHQSAAEEENRILKKKLADVEEERDILKKAVSIFSKTSE